MHMGTKQVMPSSSISRTLAAGGIRTQDHVGRMGGEEFLLLLLGVWLDGAVRIIDRIRDGFPAAVLRHSGLELACTISAGVTEALTDDDRSSILHRANQPCMPLGRRGGTAPKSILGRNANGQQRLHHAQPLVRT
jgi:diguanylate cyclase (GGDEF)-like protein